MSSRLRALIGNILPAALKLQGLVWTVQWSQYLGWCMEIEKVYDPNHSVSQRRGQPSCREGEQNCTILDSPCKQVVVGRMLASSTMLVDKLFLFILKQNKTHVNRARGSGGCLAALTLCVPVLPGQRLAERVHASWHPLQWMDSPHTSIPTAPFGLLVSKGKWEMEGVGWG